MSALPERTRTRANGLAVVGTGLHVVLGLALFAGYVYYVPAAKKVFNEFGLTLPWITQSVLRLSSWVAEHQLALVLVIGLLAVIDFLVIWALGRRGMFSLPVLWIVVVALLLFGIGALTTYAIESTMTNLREGLAG